MYPSCKFSLFQRFLYLLHFLVVFHCILMTFKANWYLGLLIARDMGRIVHLTMKSWILITYREEQHSQIVRCDQMTRWRMTSFSSARGQKRRVNGHVITMSCLDKVLDSAYDQRQELVLRSALRRLAWSPNLDNVFALKTVTAFCPGNTPNCGLLI